MDDGVSGSSNWILMRQEAMEPVHRVYRQMNLSLPRKTKRRTNTSGWRPLNVPPGVVDENNA